MSVGCVECVQCLYPVGDRCFNSRKLVRSMKSCYNGYYVNHYCYRKEQILYDNSH